MSAASSGSGISSAVGPAPERNPVRAAAIAISVVGALTGPVSFLAFPGFGAWGREDLRSAGVLALAGLIMASPFAAFLLAARLSRTKAGAAVVAALALAAVLFGALFYVEAVLRKDFVLLVASVGVPAVQWLMAIPAVVAALVLRGRKPPVPR